MWWLAAFTALASAGSKRCTMEGRSLEIRWDEAGLVKVHYDGSMVVSANIGPRKGPTSATCLPTGVKFLTDTQEVAGRFTLDTVKMDLKSVLATLQPPEQPAPAPRPKVRRKPKPKPPPPRVITPEEREARDCVQTKAFEAYGDGWSVRSITTEPVKGPVGRNLALQLFEDQEYRVMVCGASTVADLRITLVDSAGFSKAQDAAGRQAELTFRSEVNATFHLLVDNLTGDGGQVGVAILHR